MNSLYQKTHSAHQHGSHGTRIDNFEEKFSEKFNYEIEMNEK